MRFGVYTLLHLQDGADQNTLIKSYLADAILADKLGFDSVWISEHHFGRYGIISNPLMFGAAIAQLTENIKIGTSVLPLPFHNPLRLAEDIASLDVLSNGRAIFGCGRAYQPIAFNGFGINSEEARDRYNETVDILNLALSQENWSYEGKYFQYKDITTYPRPLEAGGPRLLHGAVNPESFQTLGSAGQHVITSPSVAPISRTQRNFAIYRSALAEAGYDPTAFRCPYMQQVWAGEDGASLMAVAEAALAYRRLTTGYLPDARTATEEERVRYAKIQRNYEKLSIEQMLIHGGNFGEPELVADLIIKLSRELGVDEYIGWFGIPTLDPKIVRRAMEVFSAEVMPRVREALASDETQAAVSAQA